MLPYTAGGAGHMDVWIFLLLFSLYDFQGVLFFNTRGYVLLLCGIFLSQIVHPAVVLATSAFYLSLKLQHALFPFSHSPFFRNMGLMCKCRLTCGLVLMCRQSHDTDQLNMGIQVLYLMLAILKKKKESIPNEQLVSIEVSIVLTSSQINK